MIPAPHMPERSALDEIRQLIKQMHTAARPDAISREIMGRASHRIDTLCGAYMNADIFDAMAQYKLSKYETRLAEALFSNPGRLLSKSALFDALYFDHRDEPTSDIVNVWVCKLRKKIKNSPYDIENLHGMGYRGVIKQVAPK